MTSRLRSLIRNLFTRENVDRDLDAEVRSYAALLEEENLSAGMKPEAAKRAARIELGGHEQVKEEVRAGRAGAWLETVWQDVRYGARILRKNPGFTAIAVMTLALGIGANTAIFSVVEAVLIRPLPYRESSQLIVINETTPKVGTVSVSYPNFIDWRSMSHAFSQMSAVHSVGFNLAGVSQPESIMGDAVSPNFLSMLGMRPFLGRDFDSSEDKPGTAPVVLLSHSLWKTHLGGDPQVVGKLVTLDGRSFTIVRVLPPDFRALDKTDVLVPLGLSINADSYANDRGDRGDMVVIGRLAPGATLATARVEMEGIALQLARQYPASNDQCGVALEPIRAAFVGDLQPAILVLAGAVMFVLLISCANVANLFLARGAGRTREIALRLAFGAGRRRLIRQLLTESLLLALFGGALGLALAVGGIQGITRLIPDGMLMGATVNLNGFVLLFVAGLVVLTVLVFGLAPAWHLTNPDVQSELKDGARTVTAGRAQNRLRGVLAVAEISLALVLLVGAGLMVKSLYRLMQVDPGFRPDRVLTMELELRAQRYSQKPARISFWQRIRERVAALPGVESAALGTAIPLTGNHSRTDISMEGMPPLKPGSYPHPDMHTISPGYIETLGVSLLRGRAFTEADTGTTPRVALVNDMLAKRFFPNEDPIGKRFMFGHPSSQGTPSWLTIVGVVGDTKLYGLANPSRLEVYVSYLQRPTDEMQLLVRSGGDTAALISAIRGVVASIDKDQPIEGISTMNEIVTNSISTRRVTLILLAFFSGLAVILAGIGIFGVIAYNVAQRTHEIGIRMALGAQRKHVLAMILGQGGRIALIGILIGLAAAFALTRLLESLLFSVSAFDPITFAGVASVLAIVALAASYIPARRAMRVDTMVALRHE